MLQAEEEHLQPEETTPVERTAVDDGLHMDAQTLENSMVPADNSIIDATRMDRTEWLEDLHWPSTTSKGTKRKKKKSTRVFSDVW